MHANAAMPKHRGAKGQQSPKIMGGWFTEWQKIVKIVGLLQARQFACIGVYVFTCFNKGDVFMHMHEIQVWGDSTWLTTPQRKLA